MFRTSLILIIFLSFRVILIAQDSTLIPETSFSKWISKTKYSEKWIEVHHVIYFPEFLQDAIDSVNGEKVLLKMYGDSVIQNGIKNRCEREFRTLYYNLKDLWLLTYRHYKPYSHIHFVIFKTNNKKVENITAGISDYDIDSIHTIKRMKFNKYKKIIEKRKCHKFILSKQKIVHFLNKNYLCFKIKICYKLCAY